MRAGEQAVRYRLSVRFYAHQRKLDRNILQINSIRASQPRILAINGSATVVAGFRLCR